MLVVGRGDYDGRRLPGGGSGRGPLFVAVGGRKLVVNAPILVDRASKRHQGILRKREKRPQATCVGIVFMSKIIISKTIGRINIYY